MKNRKIKLDFQFWQQQVCDLWLPMYYSCSHKIFTTKSKHNKEHPHEISGKMDQ